MGTERGKLRNVEFPGRYGRNPAGLKHCKALAHALAKIDEVLAAAGTEGRLLSVQIYIKDIAKDFAKYE